MAGRKVTFIKESLLALFGSLLLVAVPLIKYSPSIYYILSHDDTPVKTIPDIYKEFPDAYDDKIALDKARSITYKNHSKVIELCDSLLIKYATRNELPFADINATALLLKAHALAGAEKPDQAVETYDMAIRRFADRKEAELVRVVDQALSSKHFIVSDNFKYPQLSDQMITTLDQMIQRAEGRHSNEYIISLISAKRRHFERRGEFNLALKSYDEIIQRYEHILSLDPIAIADVYYQKAEFLRDNRRFQEAVATYDLIIEQYDNSEVEALQILVAKTLIQKMYTLARLDLPEQALATNDELMQRYQQSTKPYFQHVVTRAQLFRATFQQQLATTSTIQP